MRKKSIKLKKYKNKNDVLCVFPQSLPKSCCLYGIPKEIDICGGEQLSVVAISF